MDYLKCSNGKEFWMSVKGKREKVILKKKEAEEENFNWSFRMLSIDYKATGDYKKFR
jgi:hypothetical protein